MQHAGTDFLVDELLEFLLDRLDRTAGLGLDDDLEFGHLDLGTLGRQAFEAHRRERGLRRPLHHIFALLGNFASRADVVDRVERIVGVRHFIEAGNLHRRTRTGFVDQQAHVVVHGPNATVRRTAQHDIALAKRTLADEHRCHDALLAHHVGFEAGTRGLVVGVGGQWRLGEFGDEQDLLEQFGNPLPRHRARFDERDVATHVVGEQVQTVKLAARLFEVRVRHVDLVDRHDDRDFRRTGVADRFFGLRHDAIGSSHDDDNDVGDVRPARPHLGKGFVTGRIEERDLLAFFFDLPRANHLRDTARFGGNDVGLQAEFDANLVQERRFAVVDVSHDRDDRGAGLEQSRIDDVGLLDELVEELAFGSLRDLEDQLNAFVDRDEFGDFKLDGRVVAVQLAGFFQQPLAEFAGLHADRFGERAHGDRRRDFDGAFFFQRLKLLVPLHLAEERGAWPALRAVLVVENVDGAADADRDRPARRPALAAAVLTGLVAAIAARHAAIGTLLVAFFVADHRWRWQTIVRTGPDGAA